MHALRNKKVGDTAETQERVYKYVWSRDGRMFCRTEEEAKQRIKNPVTGFEGMPKPHIINKPQDLESLGWTREEILKIINNVRD